jgi:hypothetical protein
MARKRHPRQPEPSSADLDESVAALQELGASRARRLGHEVESWSPAGEPGVESWRAVCSRCGAAAYIRRERGMLGLAGSLAHERCDDSAGLRTAG